MIQGSGFVDPSPPHRGGVPPPPGGVGCVVVAPPCGVGWVVGVRVGRLSTQNVHLLMG